MNTNESRADGVAAPTRALVTGGSGLLGGSIVFTDVAEWDQFHRVNAQIRPLGGRGGTPEDVADAAEYLAGDLAGWSAASYS